MKLDFLKFDLTDLDLRLPALFTELVRWVFVLLALYILLRAIRSLVRAKNPAEVWAYMNLRTYRADDSGFAVLKKEITVPLTHWENVIGRAKNCDISVMDDTISRNHGILLRDTKGNWRYRDLGSRNGTYLNDERIGGRDAARKEAVDGRAAAWEEERDGRADAEWETGIDGRADAEQGAGRSRRAAAQESKRGGRAAARQAKKNRRANKAVKDGEMSEAVAVEYGDVLQMGMTDMTLLPISLEEKNNNIAMRKADTSVMSAGPSLAALTLFQLLTAFQLCISLGSEHFGEIFTAIGGLMAVMWIYTAVMRTFGNTAFEIETIAFLLTTLSLAVVGSSAPESMFKQFAAAAIGVAGLSVTCIILRNLERTKALKWAILIGAAVLLAANLAIGTFSYGAKNWLSIGGFSFQPSELVKVAFVWVGAATMEELFQRKNLLVFMAFSAYCFGCLGLMGDFGTAIIFFVTFLIISFLRSGDFSKLILMVGVAAVGGFMILRFKPYVASRFASWGHVWEAAVVDAAGFQQSRTMSAAASGGLVGVGAGDGWLEGVPAADTDMVFGMLIEEWGLIIAVLAVLSIVTLAFFAYRSIMAGRSTYYTIGACGATSMFIFQTMLNVFGSVDILPFTGVTFPFVSNGGTSMMVSWILLAFLKAADTRERASIAVKAGGRR